MKKVPIEVHRTSANTAQFIIPDHLDAMEVRGIVESVMERLLLESLYKATVTVKQVRDAVGNDWHTDSGD